MMLSGVTDGAVIKSVMRNGQGQENGSFPWVRAHFAMFLSQNRSHKNPNLKQFHFIGIDTDPITLQAIRDGAIDGTIAQNPFAHGYISCALLKYMLEGYKPTKPYQLVDAGDILVTKDNVDTYSQQIAAITEQLKKDLTTKYLTK
jgi:hypothetical protein